MKNAGKSYFVSLNNYNTQFLFDSVSRLLKPLHNTLGCIYWQDQQYQFTVHVCNPLNVD